MSFFLSPSLALGLCLLLPHISFKVQLQFPFALHPTWERSSSRATNFAWNEIHPYFEAEMVWRSCTVLVLGRNFTCAAGGQPRQLWGEDHYVTSIHVISSGAVYVYRYAQLILCLSLIPEYTLYTIVKHNSKLPLKYISCVLDKKCFYWLLVLSHCIHLLLKSNTAVQVASNFSTVFSPSSQICTSFLQNLNCSSPQLLQILISSTMVTAAI